MWHDMDELCVPGLHSEGWHAGVHTSGETEAHYRAIDAAVEADRVRLNVVGSLFWDVVPDAVVVVPWAVHLERLRGRRDVDAGVAAGVVRELLRVAVRHGVPVFESFGALDAHLDALSTDADPL